MLISEHNKISKKNKSQQKGPKKGASSKFIDKISIKDLKTDSTAIVPYNYFNRPFNLSHIGIKFTSFCRLMTLLSGRALLPPLNKRTDNRSYVR